MNKKIFLVIGVIVALISCAAISGCTDSFQQPGEKTQTPTPAPGETTDVVSNSTKSPQEIVADSNNAFAFSLYRLLSAESLDDENIFFSPYSVSSAFALVLEGAKGNTADEIKDVFSFPKSMDTLRQGFYSLNEGINYEGSGYSLSTANALWAEKTYPFLESYLKTAEEYYSANTTNLDFKNSPEESRLTINSWTEDKTNQKIKDLIPEGMISPLTKLVITNAVYFKGDWVYEFDKEKTQKADFYSPSGVVEVDMMQRTDEEAVFMYYESDTLKALKMPYESEGKKKLFMTVLLPKDNSALEPGEFVDADKLAEIEKSFKSQQVHVYLPKFKLETEYSLNDALEKMGMPKAFSDEADFSGMDGTDDLFISDVVHKAYVDVNEEGTEAAAATGIVFRTTSAGPTDVEVPEFLADHPFMFIIEDEESGNILFMGKVSNPAN
ncbi:serpin family protein [Methanomicrobium antiquum]|uniref:Serpin family protein n=1 Tax=Methanomicrobium antiquum TaxID=487686 RepID=A0AAF0JLI5_9EURY|nr:serpin family protein [Methanomicrobium antiquum]WFN36714.1 serpin family protein [Methanomicrobium antiquum]